MGDVVYWDFLRNQKITEPTKKDIKPIPRKEKPSNVIDMTIKEESWEK